MTSKKWWDLELEYKPDFEEAMKRIYAWYEQEIIDRPPIRFAAHNADFVEKKFAGRNWVSLKERWFDAAYQVEFFLESLKQEVFNAETFPVFWPNLGPEVYSAYYGCELTYQEVTSYANPIVHQKEDVKKLNLDYHNEYWKKIDQLTDLALKECKGKFMVGYTDLHPGMDCVAAWRDSEQLCMDIILDPDFVKEMIFHSVKDFKKIFNYYDDKLKKHDQLSVTWMNIPSFGQMHIPSCDFATLISPEQFEEFCYPILLDEVKGIEHNVFHVDGKGVAKNLDLILSVPEINAIQWVQGVGDDLPIMQWVPLIKKIQNAGKSVVVDLQLDELEDFISEVDPKGIYLCIAADKEIQPDIIKRVEKW